MKKMIFTIIVVCFSLSLSLHAKEEDTTKTKDPFNSSLFNGLKWRSIGPAFTSGRIADFAVNPDDHSEYYVAVASGNIWKTTNSGNYI